MRILAAYPYRPDNRTRVRSYETLRLLANLGDVTVVFPVKNDEVCHEVLGVTAQVVTVPDSLTGKLFRVLRAVLARKTITYSFYRNSLDAFSATSSAPFDLVFVERLPITVAVKKMGNAVIYDAVDSFEVQTKLLAHAANGIKRFGYSYDSMRIRHEQVAICNTADGVLCTTSLEVKRLVDAGVTVPTHAYLHSSQVTRLSSQVNDDQRSRPRAVFHGRGSYAANQAAGKEIFNKIAPTVPDTDFIIFGSDWAQMEIANLQILGFQKDLAMLLTADFAIFPLEVAVGVQNKVIEALSAGLPCVVTPAVADGLPVALREGLKSRIHVVQLGNFSTFVKIHSHTLKRDERFVYSFSSIYTELIARERAMAIDFIEEILARKRNR
jgi:polysaccharide biosynthesis protein PslH